MSSNGNELFRLQTILAMMRRQTPGASLRQNEKTKSGKSAGEYPTATHDGQ